MKSVDIVLVSFQQGLADTSLAFCTGASEHSE